MEHLPCLLPAHQNHDVNIGIVSGARKFNNEWEQRKMVYLEHQIGVL